MLSLAAFNAFLKTLEEPPPQAKFLFCTTEAHKLPETFTSRVQRLEFRRIDEGKMADRLRSLVTREGLAVEEGVCERIAEGALGGLRDAESLLEQLLSCAEGRARHPRRPRRGVGARGRARGREPVRGPARRRRAARIDAAGACLDGGAKPDIVLDQVVEALRAYLAAARARAADRAADGTGDRDRRSRCVSALDAPRIARILRIDLLLEKRRALRDGADGRLVVEIAAVELASLPSARDLDACVATLRAGRGAARPSAPSGVRWARGRWARVRRGDMGAATAGAGAPGSSPSRSVDVRPAPAARSRSTAPPLPGVAGVRTLGVPVAAAAGGRAGSSAPRTGLASRDARPSSCPGSRTSSHAGARSSAPPGRTGGCRRR